MNTGMGCHFLLQGSSQQIIPDKFITDSNIKTKYILFSFIKTDIWCNIWDLHSILKFVIVHYYYNIK